MRILKLTQLQSSSVLRDLTICALFTAAVPLLASTVSADEAISDNKDFLIPGAEFQDQAGRKHRVISTESKKRKKKNISHDESETSVEAIDVIVDQRKHRKVKDRKMAGNEGKKNKQEKTRKKQKKMNKEDSGN